MRSRCWVCPGPAKITVSPRELEGQEHKIAEVLPDESAALALPADAGAEKLSRLHESEKRFERKVSGN